MGEPLFATGKTIARQRTLRKNDQLRPRHGRRLEPVQDLLEVRVQPAKLRLHLDGGDAVGSVDSVFVSSASVVASVGWVRTIVAWLGMSRSGLPTSH